MVAFFEFIPFNVFIGEGLDDPDAGQCILQAGIDVADLPAVFHESDLHAFILSVRK